MKKLLVLLVLLMMISTTGCQKKDALSENKTSNIYEYVDLIKNYTPREKTGGDIDNPEFDSFLMDVFRDMISESIITAHQNIIDYSKYNLEKPEVTLGEIKYDFLEEEEEYKLYLDSLHSFDYKLLSYRQQVDYELFEYSLYESFLQLEISKYNGLFTGGNDIIGSVVTSVSEYKFREAEDVDDCLTLIDDIDRYLSDAIAYTKYQAENGIYMTDYSLNYSIDYIDSLVSKVEDNAIITEFKNRLDQFEDYPNKEEALNSCKELVIDEVIPCLNKVKSELESLKGNIDPIDKSLCKTSRELAEGYYMLCSSNNISIDKMFSSAKNKYSQMLDAYMKGIQDKGTYYEYLDVVNGNFGEPFGLSDYKTLEFLREKTNDYFPNIGMIDFTVSPLDESSAQDSIVAYYYPSPIDDINQNVIRTNPNNLGNDLAYAYSTLAHEGFPGHLFQNAYELHSGTNPFRRTQSFSGFVEGYAVYAENIALNFCDFKEEYTKDLISFESTYYFVLYSMLDLGINYYGWNEKQVAEALVDSYLFDKADAESYAKRFIELFTDRPGTYCYYGLGYVQFENLRDQSIKKLGDDFDYVEFNEAILSLGTVPFALCRQNVESYIESYNKTS